MDRELQLAIQTLKAKNQDFVKNFPQILTDVQLAKKEEEFDEIGCDEDDTDMSKVEEAKADGLRKDEPIFK